MCALLYQSAMAPAAGHDKLGLGMHLESPWASAWKAEPFCKASAIRKPSHAADSPNRAVHRCATLLYNCTPQILRLGALLGLSRRGDVSPSAISALASPFHLH